MKFLILLTVLFSLNTLAEESPHFPLGPARESWGIELPAHKEIPLKFKIGARLQMIAAQNYKHDNTANNTVSSQDFYARRARLQFKADYKENMSFSMDLRNDNANREDNGEEDFTIGDATFELRNLFDHESLRLKAFRAKIDVSRSQLTSSSSLMLLERAKITDQAAQFVSHNRRASNLQIAAVFDKWSFQGGFGDGVQRSTFYDAKGEDLGNGAIDRQNFMVGGKLRFYPFKNWEDKEVKETYFGQGQHFSFGSGIFHTGNIEYRNASGTQVDKISRTLFSHELSFHYKNLFFQTEYFRFNGVIEDFSAAKKRVGTSDGYYVQAEYVIPQLSYIAPFARYEEQDRFRKEKDYDLIAYAAGLNWYLQGNDLKLSLFYQYEKLDKNLQVSDGRNRTFDTNKQIKLASMMYF